VTIRQRLQALRQIPFGAAPGGEAASARRRLPDVQQPAHGRGRPAQGHQMQVEAHQMTRAVAQALGLAALQHGQPLVGGRLGHQQVEDG